ncbi:SDR family oxidoreductase [Sporomusa termitida]|uniref:SDR family NAD(P)-dependent oxidoreductase n=1 Tax=Sporomusa termitida TaxID=2377 RepID=UPI0011866444
MVSTVGGGEYKSILESTPDFWKKEFKLNFESVFNCFHAVLPSMVKQNHGRLLCFLSTTGGLPGLSAYGASKAACKSLLESITAEHAKDHITANGIFPALFPLHFL